jgi:CRISPR-associated protein Csx17
LRQQSFTNDEVRLTVKSLDAAKNLTLPSGTIRKIQVKASGEKATIAVVQSLMASDSDIIKGVEAGRRYFPKFQAAETREQTREFLELFRDDLPGLGVLAMDSVLTSRTAPASDNPLFLRRGEAGNAEIFRTFWSYFLVFRDRPKDLALTSLFQNQSGFLDKEKSPGSPFFPDAIETWNNGLRWVLKEFRFNALDYLLAVEGALALRGAVSRTLAANSRRFAAFPFVFDSGEDLVDDSNEVKGTASSIWLPLWDRRVTFAELESFICDAQARLPGKEARFSAEFARALRAQGVDAGFAGWQEFRFKMKASRVPWVCTGRYLGATANRQALQLNDALAPLDESGFISQFEPRYKGNKIDSRSPHSIRASLNAAIEDAIAAPTPEGVLEILVRLYAACRRVALSESFRETLLGKRAVFFKALHQEPWENLLKRMEQEPEFRIARALASIRGLERQLRQINGKPVISEVQPFLGSLLPLKSGPTGWYLPTDSKSSSKQAVWSGIDLCDDLARVLGRRYLDSLDNDLPALRSPRPAPLGDILEFLDGDFDDHRIARWSEALSLIGWSWGSTNQDDSATEAVELLSSDQQPEGWLAIPPAYAALRAILDVECEWQGNDASLWQKRRSQRPITLLCQRSSSSLALAVEEALRWLSIWGVPNCWGEKSCREKPRLNGRDIIRADHRRWQFSHDPKVVRRLAAAVVIPLDCRDQWKLYRAVTLPQTM